MNSIGIKRAHDEEEVIIDQKFIEKRAKAFSEDKALSIARNTIMNTGISPMCFDEEETRKVNHVFKLSLKGKDVKATNQYQSERCWLFAGLNMLRHKVIADFNLKDFEFSQTYLYFWQKIETADKFLHEIIELLPSVDSPLKDNPNEYDERLQQILEEPLEDGDHWNSFANLVTKYGLVPKEAMAETVHSANPNEMNKELNSRLRDAACYIHKSHASMTKEQIQKFRKTALKQIYNIVALFLGNPPETFNWSYVDADETPIVMYDLNPMSFKELTIGDENITEDYVVLANYPVTERPFNKTYEIKEENNMVGGKSIRFINLPIEELEKYTLKSLHRGQPVWITGDIERGFHSKKSALNEALIKTDLIFGERLYQMSKGERYLYHQSFGTHAMSILGVNEVRGKPIEWQVENSWGYDDPTKIGFNGFLSASADWFRENVFEIVIRKKYLTQQHKKIADSEPTQLKTRGKAATSLP